MNALLLQHIEKRIVINAPVQYVHNQCSQFGEFSRYTPYVMSIRQYDAHPSRVQMWFREKRFKCQTEKFQQWSDNPIAHWRPGCRVHQGSITLECEHGHMTCVTLEFDCAPVSPLGRTEDSPCAVETQAEAILKRFRTFIEPPPTGTEAWADRIIAGSIPALPSGAKTWTRY